MQAMNLDPSSSLGATLDTFAENMWPDGITLILAVDEMQNMEDTPQVRRNLQAIHSKRFGTNIAIVGFGLRTLPRDYALWDCLGWAPTRYALWDA